MKKLLVMTCFISLVNLVSSCSSDDSSPSDKEENKIIILSTSKGTYLETKGNKGYFDLTLTGNDISLDLKLISRKVEDTDLLEATLESHKYILSDNDVLYSLTKESFIKSKNEKLTIQSAELNIQNKDNKYLIDGYIIDSNNLKYEIKYDNTIDIEPTYNAEYKIQKGWYWGDDEYKHPGVAQYMTFFVVGNTNNYGELNGDGYRISLSLYDQKAPKAWEAKIPNKKYIANTKYETGSFYIASDKDIEKNEPVYRYAYFEHRDSSKDIKQIEYIRKNSTIKVLETPTGQEVRFNVELGDGTRHLGKYKGPIEQKDEATVTSLKTDRTVGKLDIGFLEFQGASPIDGKQNNRWNIYLYNKDLRTQPENYWAVGGSGEYMRIGLYTASSATTDIPVGEYKIGSEEPNMAAEGGGFEPGFDWGTWYYELKNTEFKDAAPGITGKIIVAKTNDEYTITIEFKDDRENTVKANYTGKLTFINNDKNKSSKQGQTTKSINKTSIFQQYKQEKALEMMRRYYGEN